MPMGPPAIRRVPVAPMLPLFDSPAAPSSRAMGTLPGSAVPARPSLDDVNTSDTDGSVLLVGRRQPSGARLTLPSPMSMNSEH